MFQVEIKHQTQFCVVTSVMGEFRGGGGGGGSLEGGGEFRRHYWKLRSVHSKQWSVNGF